MKAIVFTLLALLSLTCFAAKPLPRIPVASLTSHPGESLDGFLARVAAVMKTAAAETHHEICGVMAVSETAYGVNLVTGGSHVACYSDPLDVPAGMVALNTTIHIHTPQKRFRLNQADLSTLGPGYRASAYYHSVPNEFSADDYATGPGWLVGEDFLYFQHGPGTAEAVLAL